MRIYLDSSVLIVYCFGRELAPEKYKKVKRLFANIASGQIDAVISFYSLHEVFMFSLENFPKEISRGIGKEALLTILTTGVKIAPLLNREQRIIYSKDFKIRDSSDVPHAISAFIEKCDSIVTYDRHFDDVKDKIKVMGPDELL